jgi:hypothetical protein
VDCKTNRDHGCALKCSIIKTPSAFSPSCNKSSAGVRREGLIESLTSKLKPMLPLCLLYEECDICECVSRATNPGSIVSFATGPPAGIPRLSESPGSNPDFGIHNFYLNCYSTRATFYAPLQRARYLSGSLRAVLIRAKENIPAMLAAPERIPI